MAHSFIFSTVTFVIFRRSENFRTKQSITFRFERPVINCLWLLYFSMRPRPDHVRGRQRHTDGIKPEWVLGFFKEAEKIFHFFPPHSFLALFLKQLNV